MPDKPNSPLLVAFVASASGSWRIDRINPVIGEGLPAADRLEMVERPVLVQTRARTECRLGVAAVSVGKSQAASAAFHSSDIVDIRIPSLPVLNWRFLIFSANSIPLRVIAALSNRLNPSIGRIRCFTRR